MTPSPDIPEKELREKCTTILSAAADEARRLGHNYVGTEHLFISATRNDGLTCQLLKRAGFSPRQVRNEIRREIGTADGPASDVLPLTPRTAMVLSLAIFLAEQDNIDEVQEEHMLMALLQEGEGVPVRKLVDMGFDLNLWLQRLITEQQEQLSPPPDSDDDFDDLWSDDDLFDFGNEPEILTNRPHSPDDKTPMTPLLDRYGRDLTAQAAEGKIGEAIARTREIRAVARTLSRSKKNNPLLLGDAGVGKTAIVEGLAYAIHHKTAPAPLLHRRIVQIEIGTLVAGTSLRGQFEERLIGIVEEVKRSGNIIMFIDEIHTIVGAGDTIDSNLDAANILKPALARGEIMCIGATTHEEYRRAIAQDPALDRRFRTIDVEEPKEKDAVEILKGQKYRLEEHHMVEITDDTIEAAVKLSVRYMPDRRLPDKALDLLDEACTRVTIRTIHPDVAPEDQDRDVRISDVSAVLSEWTGIPITELNKDEKKRLANLEATLSKRVIGQERAVTMVSDAIRTARAGLNDPNRPIGVFLFLGTSGVGKTELARALADVLFGTEDAILRLDMSEFHDAHTVARLIGSPPGYKESNRGGQLTDGLRRRPYSVVLMDEIEKAAPEVFDIFLQIFDDGRVSDAHGRVVDARHSVFIMTSNIGTQESSRVLGFGASDDDAEPDFQPYLKQFFRLEFLNRIDEVVTFKQLSKETLGQILEIQLEDIRLRLRDQKLALELSDESRTLLIREGYDPVNGARPIRRAIERLITRPLSVKIVEDAFEFGDTIIAVPDGEGGIEFEKKEEVESSN
ncbi:MAG: ATP-dependent Clp protease ATP-binding subunit [Anaerolineae bacterium]|nr:ATP-dependent Clp protease ATP-binding subunit [Anaerolineae bacterium]